MENGDTIASNIKCLIENFESAINNADTEKAYSLIELYLDNFGETSEYYSIKSVFYDSIGDYDNSLLSLKRGLVKFTDISDLLYNLGCIFYDKKKYKAAFIFFCLTDSISGDNSTCYNTTNYLSNLSDICEQTQYSNMSKIDAKLFYRIWNAENKMSIENVNYNTDEFIDNIYELVLVSYKCMFVPREIKQSVMNYVLYCFKNQYAVELEHNLKKRISIKLIDLLVELKDNLRRIFKINVAICGMGEKTFLVRNILSLDNTCIKAYISDNPKMNSYANTPLICSTDVGQNDYDYFILIESDDVKNLFIYDLNKLINYESYWNLIFTHSHNWAVYLNSIERISESDGIVLGISYTLRAINTKYFTRKMCNISASSQDLFYDLMLLKEVLLKDNGKLQHCVIGLAKYSFEYDLSLSSQNWLLGYYYYRTHSTHNNKDTALKDQINQINMLNDIIFLEDHTVRFASNFRALCDQQLYNYNNQLFDSNYLDDNSRKNLITEIEKDFDKNYPLTVQENHQIFEEILILLKKFKIKATVVVCPVTDFYKEHINGTKVINDFENAINYFQNKYQFQYLDYFESDFFNESDFMDASHLNIKGAEKFTRLLDTEILW